MVNISKKSIWARYGIILRPVEVSMLCAMIGAEDADGWMRIGQISEQKRPDCDRPLVRTKINSFPRFLDMLHSKGFVEKLEKGERYIPNRKGKQISPCFYRIRKEKIEHIQKAIVSFSFIYKGTKTLGYDPGVYFYMQCRRSQRFREHMAVRDKLLKRRLYGAALMKIVMESLKAQIPLQQLQEDITYTYNMEVNK